MLRAIGTLAVAVVAGYLAVNGGSTPWFELGTLPTGMIAFTVVSGAVIYGLWAI